MYVFNLQNFDIFKNLKSAMFKYSTAVQVGYLKDIEISIPRSNVQYSTVYSTV